MYTQVAEHVLFSLPYLYISIYFSKLDTRGKFPASVIVRVINCLRKWKYWLIGWNNITPNKTEQSQNIREHKRTQEIFLLDYWAANISPRDSSGLQTLASFSRLVVVVEYEYVVHFHHRGTKLFCNIESVLLSLVGCLIWVKMAVWHKRLFTLPLTTVLTNTKGHNWTEKHFIFATNLGTNK